jgi:DNA-binding response OmpR family regulator
MTDTKVRHLLLLTDDDFHAEVLGTYMRRDSVEVERVATPEDAAQGIAAGADGVLVDLAKKGITADAIMTLSGRAQRWEIPMLILSSQPRRDLTDFAAVVRATDVVSKTEAITAIAARIRMCLMTPLRKDTRKSAATRPPSQSQSEPLVGWALAV